MTEENYNYRTSQTLLRNQFPGKGKFKIPIIPKFQERPGDFDDLLLIGFDKTHLGGPESPATIHRFPKCRATLSMWITNAVPGGI